MKTIITIIILMLSSLLSAQSVMKAMVEYNSQKPQEVIKYPIIKEYKQVINHKLQVLASDIRIIINADKVEVLYFNPNTNFKELYKKDEYRIEKYVGEMPADEKGYKALVFTCQNGFIFSVYDKSSTDHWCMLSHSKLEGHTIFQDPVIGK